MRKKYFKVLELGLKPVQSWQWYHNDENWQRFSDLYVNFEDNSHVVL